MTIQSQGFGLTPSLETFTRRQIRQGMMFCSNQIEHIIVRLKDINGKRGGVDKQCSVEVKLYKEPTLVVTKTSPDMYANVRHTTSRAARTALRKLKKRRAKLLRRRLETKQSAD